MKRIISKYKIKTTCPECKEQVFVPLGDDDDSIFQIGSIFFDIDRDGETKRQIKRDARNLRTLESTFKSLERFGIKMEKKEEQDFNIESKMTILVYLYTFKKHVGKKKDTY